MYGCEECVCGWGYVLSLLGGTGTTKVIKLDVEPLVDLNVDVMVLLTYLLQPLYVTMVI